MNINVLTLPCGAYQENAYLVCAPNRADCVMIDPGDNLPGLKRALVGVGRHLTAILLTHGHFDHTLAAQTLAEAAEAPIYIHAGDLEMLNDPAINAYDPSVASLPAPSGLTALAYGNCLSAGGMEFRVLSTPGHTRGSVCLYLPEDGVLFSGDTLFQAGFGRVDLYGGSAAQMRASLRALFALPPEVRVYPGHGPETTISQERARYRL